VLPNSQQTQVALTHYNNLQDITFNAILGDSKYLNLSIRIYTHTTRQQMHYYDVLLISYSSYMFGRMYVIAQK
jgi:hypothetical protein